jgi:multiple antibiotic resistance protein
MDTYLLMISSLIVVIGPWKSAIVFAERTTPLPLATRRLVAVATVVLAFAIAVVLVILGSSLVALFEISAEAFLVAAGLLLFVFATRMVITEEQPPTKPVAESDVDRRTPWRLAAYPLAVPMLVTPPAMAALVAISVLVRESGDRLLPAIAAIATVLLFDLVVFLTEAQWERRVPIEFWSVAGRVLGVLLAGFGMTIILAGLRIAGVVPERL